MVGKVGLDGFILCLVEKVYGGLFLVFSSFIGEL